MGSNNSLLFAMGLMIIVYYFLLIRPQQQRAKRHKAMIAGLQKGDQVVLQGGIKGKVSQVKADDTFVSVEIAKGVDVEVVKSTIQTVLNPNASASTAKPAAASKPAKVAKPAKPANDAKK